MTFCLWYADMKKASCHSRLRLVSTYTHAKGAQVPKTVFIKRCEGGSKNPENFQCQPSIKVVKCFHTLNVRGQSEFLGIYSHERCEERCICSRKACHGQQIFDLICPKGLVFIFMFHFTPKSYNFFLLTE